MGVKDSPDKAGRCEALTNQQSNEIPDIAQQKWSYVFLQTAFHYEKDHI